MPSVAVSRGSAIKCLQVLHAKRVVAALRLLYPRPHVHTTALTSGRRFTRPLNSEVVPTAHSTAQQLALAPTLLVTR